ncbi:MAG: hypothetical protein P8Y81_13330, partial [Ignavibacteriaceae bacterium]
KKYIKLSKEIEFIKNYIELEKLRLEKNANVNLSVEGKSDTIEIAPMLFIPFVENSFKHGMKASVNSGFVNILFRVEGNKLNFTISNNKPVLKEKSDESTKMGLENVHRRLDLLYDGKYKLTINEYDKEYKTELVIEI